jgi:hypothetical protein
MPSIKFADAIPDDKILLYIEGSAGQVGEILLDTPQSLVSQLKELQKTLRAPVSKNNKETLNMNLYANIKSRVLLTTVLCHSIPLRTWLPMR